jgi:NAD-dependent dihydropyrimidine dehydrogenase PreA subunit
MGSMASIIISQNRGGDRQGERLERQLTLAFGSRRDLAVTVIPHLYDLPDDGPALDALRAAEGDLVVFCWLYPRAAYWLLNAHRVSGRLGRTSSWAEGDDIDGVDARPSAERTIWCFDLRNPGRLETYLEEVDALVGAQPEAIPAVADRLELVWERIDQPTEPRCFPVIDYSRCGGCRQCLDYCVFGVFGVDPSDHIIVDDRNACRRECRQCLARCQRGAILFPDKSDRAGRPC